MFGGVKDLPSGQMLKKQNPILLGTINRVFLQIWDTMTYAIQTLWKNKLHWQKYTEYTDFAITIIGLMARDS